MRRAGGSGPLRRDSGTGAGSQKRRLPWAEENLRKQVQLIIFADVGAASLRRPLVGEKKNKDLAGAGAGFRVHLYDKFYGRLEWAVPLGDRPFDGRDKAFYFTISYDFL